MITSTASTPFVRKLQMTAPGTGHVRDVVVRVGLPERDPRPGGDFRVLVEVVGFDQAYARHFHGVDELQAFLEACAVVPAVLAALAPAGAKLTWLGEVDLGFGTSSK